MLKKWITLLIPGLFLIGCDLSEDLSGCGILRLNMRYIYNNENVDKLSSSVGDVRIYLFDEATGILADIVEPSAADIQRGRVEVNDLPDGKYTARAWAGSGNDMLNGGFFEAHMSDPSTHSYTEFAATDQTATTLDKFYMMLDCDPLVGLSEADMAPKNNRFDDLFFASAVSIEFDRTANRSADLDFRCNANVLNVTITGLEHLSSRDAELPLSVYAIASNGRYNGNNMIDGYAPTVLYSPYRVSADGNTMEADIKTLSIDLNRHSADPILLYVKNNATGRDIIEPLNVIEAIMQVKDNAGNYLYRTQEQIDREYEFPIRIEITDNYDPNGPLGLGVRIFINDWEIVYLDPDVNRP